jgi:hypothetical protein
LVVNSVSEFLLAAQVSFGRLNRGVTQEKLNLFQLSSREMAQTSACPPQVMWSEALDSGALSSASDDVPDCFGRDFLAPYNSILVHATENVSACDVRVCGPIIEGRLDPSGHGHSPNVLALSNQVREHPVVFPNLQVLHAQSNELCPPESTPQQHGENRPVTFAT